MSRFRGHVPLCRSAIMRRLRYQRLESRLLLTNDFGDAPAPYPTLLADDGAQHIVGGPRLGTTVDTEEDGIPSQQALSDSDDGVVFSSLRVGNLEASATINVQGGDAYLDAWIDFNRDGSLSGFREQIAHAHPVRIGRAHV